MMVKIVVESVSIAELYREIRHVKHVCARQIEAECDPENILHPFLSRQQSCSVERYTIPYVT